MAENLTNKLEESVKPLDEYIKTYNEYKKVLNINADEYVRNIE